MSLLFQYSAKERSVRVTLIYLANVSSSSEILSFALPIARSLERGDWYPTKSDACSLSCGSGWRLRDKDAKAAVLSKRLQITPLAIGEKPNPNRSWGLKSSMPKRPWDTNDASVSSRVGNSRQ